MTNQTFIFFLKMSNLKHLLTLKLHFEYTEEKAKYSLFHMKILKCRELIFNETNLLASPANVPGPYIIAIVDKAMLNSPNFEYFLCKIGLQIMNFEETTPTILQECLQYTSIAKLSPSWNLVGNILVQGTDFLTSNTPINAVKMEILATYNEISLCLQPTCIRIPPLRMENYEKPEVLETSKFLRMNDTCHVLPSFKKGKIVSATKSLEKQPFKTYKELQKHWRDMYGYILPDIEGKNIWFLNVRFFNSTSYIYPEFCVKPYEMIFVPRIDPRKSLCFFVKDFCKMIGNICGEKCKVIEYKASFPFLAVYPANEITEYTRPRPGTTYTMKSEVAYRSIENMINKSGLKENNSVKMNSNSVDRKNNHSTILSSQMKVPLNKQDDNSEKISNILPNVSKSSGQKTHTKYAPCFQSKKPQPKLVQLKLTQSSSQGMKYAPTFFPVKKNAREIKSNSLNRKKVCKQTLLKEITVKKAGVKENDCKKKELISGEESLKKARNKKTENKNKYCYRKQ